MKNVIAKGLAASAATALAGLALVASASPTGAAPGQTIVGQGAYLCQSKPDGLPFEEYDVTLRISLNAPASVAPGQTVSLSGTATLQFPEKAYQEGKQYGVTSVDGYSNTLSVATTVNGKTGDVAANRWQTAPFPWSDPVVVTAPITIQSFKVPSNATGSVVITLPRNQRAAPNTASSSPRTVAFNGVANNKTIAGNVPEKLGCYLRGPSASVMGRIPIATPGSGSSPTANSSSADTSASSGASSGSGSQAGAVQSTATPTAAGSPGRPQQAPLIPGDVTAAGGSGLNSTVPTATSAGNPATESGVYVSTNLLILGGAAICIAALGYAALTNYRLRSIKRALDG